MASPAPSHSLEAEIHRRLRQYFSEHTTVAPAPGLYARVIDVAERPLLQLTMEFCDGNQIKAARLLGLNRNTLHKKLKAHRLLNPTRRAS